MENLLLPIAITLSVFIAGISLFKKFLKLIIVLALVAGIVSFYTQDVFAFELFGSSIEENEVSKSSKPLRSVYIMIQNEDDRVLIFEKKRFLLMTVSEDNEVILFDKKARKFDIGELSEPTIKKMIKDFFGDLKLYNVIDQKE